MAYLSCWRSVFLVCVLFGFGLSVFAQAGKEEGASDGVAGLIGKWEGKCQDGRAFVELTLQREGNQFIGTASIANMHGDDEGACMLVTAPPTADHALKISNAIAKHETLSFRGTQPSNASSAQFELKQIATDKAELKLLHTPVEKHPWLLVRVQQPN